ncbi:MAG: 50S ribosomal protein L13, partial [Flavobacteriales bacterium]|nr:50S ribosomal protein L13 [Flavobacteriales bacterium]
PHVNCGDHVIIINAEKVRLTGTKLEDKEYQRYSLYPGGQTREKAKNLKARKPEALLEIAVRGMLPKNRLGRRLFNNLHVVVGNSHKHEAQKPRNFDLNTLK